MLITHAAASQENRVFSVGAVFDLREAGEFIAGTLYPTL